MTRNENYIPAAVCLVLLCVAFLGCTPRRVEAIAVDTDPVGWKRTEAIELVYENSDTVSLRTIHVFLRSDFTFFEHNDSLRLAIETISPDSLTYREPLTLYFPKNELGLPRELSETAQVYRTGVVLGKKGDYTFRISHDSPDQIGGIRAVGINIIP